MSNGIGSFLRGIRVLDMSRHLPGPLATLLLADMGAEVVKVEPPDGDDMRWISAPGHTGRSPSFDALNANKVSRRIDLRSERGRADLLALTDAADVVLESFRPGVLERLGVGFAVMRARNPALICCAMSGFGRSGAMAQQPGHDINYLALAGLLSYSGNAAGLSIPTPPIADLTASLIAISAILGALHRRQREGTGCEIDLGIADCVMIPQIMQLAELRDPLSEPRRGAEFNTGGTAYYNVYPTNDDGMVAIGAMEPRFWENFCLAAGREDWVPRHGDPLPQKELIAEVATLFASMSRSQACKRFGSAECCFSVVHSLSEAVHASHTAQRGLVQMGKDGILQSLFPVHIDGQPPKPRKLFREMPPQQ